MSAIRYFRSQAYNNAWANHRLLTAVKRLTAEELSATRSNFFPSIIDTLKHVLTVDWFYVSALEDRGAAYAEFAAVRCTAIADVEREQRAVDRRLIAVCCALDDSQLTDTIELVRDGWIQTEPKDRTLLHIFQHQVHHRGQVHAMLAGTPVAPPQLDEFFPGHERERALREGDFILLGFDEEEIWQ